MGRFERFLEWFTTGGVSAQNLAKGFPGQAEGPDGGSDAGSDGGSGSSDGGVGSPDGGGLGWTRSPASIWDFFVLEKDYEVVTGGFPGDAQPCFGDSGSSLVKYKDGKYVSYGVVSGGLGTNDLICDLGTVYASFGPEVAAFLDKAKTWVDPCGDTDTKGVCDGNVAKRCTNIVEGRRRVVEFDCGLVGMECNTLTGQVSCDGNVFGPPPPTRPTPRTPPRIRQMVDGVFKGAAATEAARPGEESEKQKPPAPLARCRGFRARRWTTSCSPGPAGRGTAPASRSRRRSSRRRSAPYPVTVRRFRTFRASA